MTIILTDPKAQLLTGINFGSSTITVGTSGTFYYQGQQTINGLFSSGGTFPITLNNNATMIFDLTRIPATAASRVAFTGNFPANVSLYSNTNFQILAYPPYTSGASTYLGSAMINITFKAPVQIYNADGTPFMQNGAPLIYNVGDTILLANYGNTYDGKWEDIDADDFSAILSGSSSFRTTSEPAADPIPPDPTPPDPGTTMTYNLDNIAFDYPISTLPQTSQPMPPTGSTGSLAISGSNWQLMLSVGYDDWTYSDGVLPTISDGEEEGNQNTELQFYHPLLTNGPIDLDESDQVILTSDQFANGSASINFGGTVDDSPVGIFAKLNNKMISGTQNMTLNWTIMEGGNIE
jgi:hypothetical protein